MNLFSSVINNDFSDCIYKKIKYMESQIVINSTEKKKGVRNLRGRDW